MTSESQTDSLDLKSAENVPPPGLVENSEFATPENPVLAPRPWGPGATIGWTLLCIVVMFAAQIFGLVIFVVFRIATTTSPKFDDLLTSGNVIALATLLSTSAAVGLIALLIRIRRYPIRDYLVLYWPTPRSAMISLAGLAVLLGATDLSSYLLGRPLVPTVMVDIYRGSWLPALLFALVVLAPIGEETLFRGFLYMGIAASRAGPIVAILVSSVAFALLHVQYDWHGIVAVLATGLYLGVVRSRSQSLLLTMLLHAVGNAFATLEIVVLEHWLK
jgi:membrane protease YdiL (CAAX protease family)